VPAAPRTTRSRIIDHHQETNIVQHFSYRHLAATALVALAACGDDSPVRADRTFIEGTGDDPEIALVTNSTENTLAMFRLGDAGVRREVRKIPFGASSAVSAVGLAVRGTNAVVPLGNAATTALVDLSTQQIKRYFRFDAGNATGAAWVNDSTVLVANLIGNYLGRFRTGQQSDVITDTVAVAEDPTAIVIAAGRALVVSSNLDENYDPRGQGVVTAIDPVTMAVLGTVQTGATNPTDAALGPDGKLYVINVGDYAAPATLTVIDPATLTVEATIPDVGVGSGRLRIDEDGMAYLSSFSKGTLVFNTATRQFVRGPDNPVCAPLATSTGTVCRGAADADVAADGRLYQAFFGSARSTPPREPYVFVYQAATYELIDSVSVGPGFVGPFSVDIENFGQ